MEFPQFLNGTPTLALQNQQSDSSTCDQINAQIQLLIEHMETQGIVINDDDIEGLRAYLVTKPQWEEVYRRLADS